MEPVAYHIAALPAQQRLTTALLVLSTDRPPDTQSRLSMTDELHPDTPMGRTMGCWPGSADGLIDLLIAEFDQRESAYFMEQSRVSPYSERFEYFNGAIDEVRKSLKSLRQFKQISQ